MNHLEKVSELNSYNDLVSVITPAYNCEKYIDECIKSVIDQTFRNWEMIIVNDKSSDQTLAIIEKHIAIDSRIKVLNQPINMGAAAARNRAIEMSKGRFIAFLDSDDIWKYNKLERQVSFMLKYNYSFTFTAYETKKSSTKGRNKIFHVPSKVTYEQYLKNTIIGCLTVIMDRKQMGEIKFETGHLEDVLTWMKYLRSGYCAYGLDENLATYRIAENSISSNKIQNAKRYYICLRKRQNLSFIKSINCQFFYMFNAIKKKSGLSIFEYYRSRSLYS